MNSVIKLRPANPLLEEGLEYARFLDQAAEGFFALMLGKRFAEVIADGFSQPGHDFSFDKSGGKPTSHFPRETTVRAFSSATALMLRV